MGADEDLELRGEWRDLVERRLPQAAAGSSWPVRFDHCFARIFLDVACDRPWREVISPPAWRNAPLQTLARAIELAQSVLNGDADLHKLNQRSLELRGKRSASRA